jgi:hypothetical protein
MIEKLILLSPVGLSSKYQEIKSTRLEDMLQTISFKTEKTPANLFKTFSFIGHYIFEKICTEDKFKGLDKKVNRF